MRLIEYIMRIGEAPINFLESIYNYFLYKYENLDKLFTQEDKSMIERGMKQRFSNIGYNIRNIKYGRNRISFSIAKKGLESRVA